jgi:predicted Zn finger-like uncharacterized protein
MIIQCEQCRTKFKLDDSKVPAKGVKVRCAKCRHVFSVTKEQPEAELQTDFGSILDVSVSSRQDEADVQPEISVPEDASAFEFDDTDSSQIASSENADLTVATPFEIDEDLEVPVFPETNDIDQNPAPEEDSIFPSAQINIQDADDDVDFGAFDFGDDTVDTETSDVTPALDFGDVPKVQLPPPIESQKEEFTGLDFSGDDMFGEVVTATPEESPESISFDFGMDDFADSMGVEDTAAGQKNASTTPDVSSDAPFSLDEIDFGDELTSVGVQHVNPEELKPSQELLFAPLAEAQTKPVARTENDSPVKSPAPQEELPPLSIASRRKQSPLLTGLVAVLGTVIIGVVAFFGYSMFAGEKTNNTPETGRISVRQVDAKFVKNKSAGDLLVISGEAVNEFSKPRAAIQIKGMVFGTGGEVLSSKNAFCGNPLTTEQLSTMSMEKIEAAMANQFGDSLANMEVAPGKTIPFMIVIAKPATGAKDYGVEPAGSTVATGKQQ